jgi:hypothetical protein
MKVAKLIGVFAPQFREPSTCEACGSSFTCGATLSGCWCSEIETTPELRSRLRDRFARCLCRSCLEGFAESERSAEGACE